MNFRFNPESVHREQDVRQNGSANGIHMENIFRNKIKTDRQRIKKTG
jgi:hypothetical protein